MPPSHPPAHHHHPETTGRLLWLATGLTLAYAGVEAGVSWWAGSLALVADAGHMATVPGVASVHDLHIWSVASEQIMLSAHLVVRDLRQWETVLDACHALLAERFAIEHATLQPEPMVRTVRWLDAQGGESAHHHPRESAP